MRAVAYIRVSTRRQASEGVSLEAQREAINRFANEKEWTLVETYFENGASARDDKRPQFQRLLADARSRPPSFDCIIVYDRSRFYRQAADCELTIRDLRRNGVEVFSTTQPNGSDDSADMIRQLIGVVDEHSSRETARRVRVTMIENAKQGYWNGSTPPFGYSTTIVERRGKREKKKLAIDEVEASVVELIFRLAEVGHDQSGPMGVKRIAEHLNANGYGTRRGALWHISPLHNLLTNPVYKGEYRYNTSDSVTGQPRPDEDHIRVGCPAIIDARRYDAVQLALKSRNPRIAPPRLVTGPILLTGLLTCAKCGSALTMRTGKSGRYRYYACAGRQARGSAACSGCSHRMERVDQSVTDALVEKAFDPTRLTKILEGIAAHNDTAEASASSELIRLETELASARERIHRLMTLVETGLTEATDHDFARRLQSAQKDRDIAAAGLDRLRKRFNAKTEITAEQIVQFSQFMKDRVRNGEIPYRKSYIRSVVDRIIVEDERIMIKGRTDVLQNLVPQLGTGGAQVPTAVPDWRSHQDSNLGPTA